MANTRITQGVIKPNEDYDVRHIDATGIVTATDANITGNLTVGGVLTYEDVTNVDSVGIVTARIGVKVPTGEVTVGNNIQLGNAGVITATSFSGSGANLTGIDATALKDPAGNVKVQAQDSGAVHTGISTFDTINVGSGVTIESNGQATFTGIVTFGSSSTTIDGDGNTIKVGTALTLGHTQGLQFHTQNLHSAGFEINQINASGIITASEFRGDGSNLTSLPAGLGTALSSTQSSPLNKIYYTNTVLPVESTITVDTPASASAAYTQYTDISVGSGADLIISDGDDLIPDVLGLRPDGTFGGGALGRMRVDKLVGKDANSAVNVEKGLVISGVTTSTAADIDDFVSVGSNIHLGNAGIITATSFSGDGSNLTGITQTTISGNGDNKLITGSGTANTLTAEADLTFDGTNLKLTDHKNMYFGTGNDLRIWHDANNSYSQISSGQMNFYIDGLTTYMRSGNGSSGVENAIVMNNNSSVDLYHSGTKKFETTSTGVKVSGGTVELQSDMVRVGNRTTAQINAGVSTATGSLTLDTTDNTLKYYANATWKAVKQQGNDGSSQNFAARSAKELLDLGITSNGVYWLDMHGAYSSGNAKRHYCLQDTSYDGGGWTMLWCMNHGNNFASGTNYSYALNVGSPTSVSDFTAGNWGYDRRNTFTPQANDQFLIRRSDNNDWRRFVVTTWSPTANSVSNGWTTTRDTTGTNRSHPYYALGQMYDTGGSAVSGMIHFNGCALGGNCATGGGDSDGFGDHINWSSGYAPYNCWGGAFTGTSNGGSPLYWGQSQLSQGGSLYVQMFYRRTGTQ